MSLKKSGYLGRSHALYACHQGTTKLNVRHQKNRDKYEAMTCEKVSTGSESRQAKKAGKMGVYDHFRASANRWPSRVAIETQEQTISYQELAGRVDKVAGFLMRKGIQCGDRIAVLSENRSEYLEVHLAAASMGVIVACQNWRLTSSELQQCLDLVRPAIVFCSPEQDQVATNLRLGDIPLVFFGDNFDEAVESSTPLPLHARESDPELGLLILYTSGTTGQAKAALISQRAICWRMCLLRIDLRIDSDDAYLAWSPMFHMGGSEHSLSTLMMGGRVIISKGFDAAYMAQVIATRRLGWLLLVPATITPLMAALRESGGKVAGIKTVGSMADLMSASSIAELTSMVKAPFFNSFGSTETGLAPVSGDFIPIGVAPRSLAKSPSSLCAFRLVLETGLDAPKGEVGEIWVRGPTLFSGYWNDREANAREFQSGWFRMGDLFRINVDGRLEFVGRAKYMIKSGGENIYPAEIETLLLSHPAVKDAIVVKKHDSKWGEVPVAVVFSDNPSLEASVLESLCRQRLARYKQPREIHFNDFSGFSRNATGKVLREEVEDWVCQRDH